MEVERGDNLPIKIIQLQGLTWTMEIITSQHFGFRYGGYRRLEHGTWSMYHVNMVHILNLIIEVMGLTWCIFWSSIRGGHVLMTPQGIYSMKIFVSLLSRNFAGFQVNLRSNYSQFYLNFIQKQLIFSQFCEKISLIFIDFL